jgi:glycosyltransferase involved in cell wall biosynthesis
VSRPLRVLLLPMYPRRAASARQRFFMYVDRLRTLGIDCDLAPFHSEAYLVERFEHAWRARAGTAGSYARRIRALRSAREYDLIVVHFEFFPWVPWMIEQAVLPRDVPFLVDFDDAWHAPLRTHPIGLVRAALGTKLQTLISRAAGVLAGSSLLAEYASAFNPNVALIPTAVDLGLFPKQQSTRKAGGPFTVGWLGSPATTAHLAGLAPTLSSFAERTGSRILAVGSNLPPGTIQNLTLRPWSEATEVDLLEEFDVGIMPLPDSEFTRGKCAFKLLQYMAAWKPTVASPVGENRRVVRDGENGFLASSGEEWSARLDDIRTNVDAARRMGRAGRKLVESRYSADVVVNEIARMMRQSA